MRCQIFDLLYLTLPITFPYRTFNGGDLVIPKETQDLLSNMTFGSSDIQPPSMFQYLPHLMGKANGLKPQLKLSKGRFGGMYNIQIFMNVSLSFNTHISSIDIWEFKVFLIHWNIL